MTDYQRDFVRKVAAFISDDDNKVIAYEEQLMFVGQLIEKRIVLKIGEKTTLTLKLEEPIGE